MVCLLLMARPSPKERISFGKTDHPDAVDFDLLADTILKISHGLPTKIAHYDFITHKRFGELDNWWNTILMSIKDNAIDDPCARPRRRTHSRNSHALHRATERSHGLESVPRCWQWYAALEAGWVCFSKVVFAKRPDKRSLVIRDTEHRYQKDIETILETYLNHVKPAFEDFILPTKKYADVVIPRGEENTVAIELLTEHLMDILCSGKSSELFRQARPTKGDLYSRSLLLRDENALLYHPVPNWLKNKDFQDARGLAEVSGAQDISVRAHFWTLHAEYLGKSCH